MTAGFNGLTWKKNEIIRNKNNGHPFLVICIHRDVCTVVVDLQDTSDLPSTKVLLPRMYEHFICDSLYN